MEFRNVWVRGAKDHVEGLIDINFNTVLKMSPAGNDYKVSGSGRIIKKETVNTGNADTEEQHALPHGRQDTGSQNAVDMTDRPAGHRYTGSPSARRGRGRDSPAGADRNTAPGGSRRV